MVTATNKTSFFTLFLFCFKNALINHYNIMHAKLFTFDVRHSNALFVSRCVNCGSLGLPLTAPVYTPELLDVQLNTLLK